MRHVQLFVVAGIAVLLAVICNAARAAASQAVTRPFTIGYLQTVEKVGMLEVVARFDGVKWVNTWEGTR